MIRRDQISIRDFSEVDIQPFLDYFYRAPPGYLEGMSVDPSKMGPEEDLRKTLIDELKKNALLPVSKLTRIIVLVDGAAIGIHSVNQMVKDESAVFHAHFWKPEWRGQGIGVWSYLLASEVFIKRFSLQKIIYKTPKVNLAANRLKKKIGARLLGDALISFSIVKDNTPAWVYELTLADVVFSKNVSTS